MAAYAFDIYPADDPAGKISETGSSARLVRITVDGQAASGYYRHVLHGTGSGWIEIHTDHADATETNFAKRNYVIFVRTDTDPEQEIGGFWLEEGDFAALSRRERGGRILHFEGPGSLFILDRMTLLEQIYAPDQDYRGTDPVVPGMWSWRAAPAGVIGYGGILVRLIEEGQNAPGAPYAAVTLDFDRDVDSTGDSWVEITDFKTPIGTNGLDLLQKLLQAGLVVQSSADLEIHAYDSIDNFSTDRTSSTFASGKVRFEAGKNIAADLSRSIQAKMERSRVLVEDGDGAFAVVTLGGSGEEYYDYVKVDAVGDAALLVGQTYLTNRAKYSDQAKFPHLIGPGGTSGADGYAPGPAGDYWVGDLVTLHTGDAEHDFNEQALEVAAVSFTHDAAGNWMAEAELGAQYISFGTRRFEEAVSSVIRSTNSHSHPEMLCEPGTTQAITCDNADTVGTELTLTNPGLESGTTHWYDGVSAGQRSSAQAHSGTYSSAKVNDHRWYTPPEFVVTAGKKYVIKWWQYVPTGNGEGYDAITVGHSLVANNVHWGNSGHYEDSVTATFDTRTPQNEWVQRCVEYTPASSHASGMRVDFHLEGYLDDVQIWEGELADSSDISLTGTSNRAARCDHNHEHNDLLDLNTIDGGHTASAVSIADAGGYFTGTDVEAALQELASGTGGSGSLLDLIHGRFLYVAHKQSDSRAYLLTSRDGITFTEVQDTALFEPSSGDARDPSYVHWNGKHYLAHTTYSASSVTFRLWESDDLLSWTNVANPSVAGARTSASAAWAPHFFVDPSDGTLHVFIAVGTGGEFPTNFKIYETHPSDPADLSGSWSTPVEVTGTGFESTVIDPFMVYAPDIGTEGKPYKLFWKSDVAGDANRWIGYSESAALTSGFASVETGDWAGWKDVESIEAPCIVRLDNDRWRAYFNENDGLGSVAVYYSDSDDDWATWSARAAVTTPDLMGHGDVIHLLSALDHDRDPDAHRALFDAISGGASALDDLTDVVIATPSDGQVLTYDSGSGQWVNENSATGFSNPMTAAGDIIVGGGSGAASRLAAGSAGEVLTISGGSPAWASPATGGSSESWEDVVGDLVSDLVHRWKFEEASGNFSDEVGTYDLTASGTITYSVASPLGSGVTFASGARGTGTGMGSLPVGAAARTTVCIYKSTGNLSTNAGLYGYGNTGTARQWWAQKVNDGAGFQDSIAVWADDLQVASVGGSDGEWHMIAGAYNAGRTLLFFEDGVVRRRLLGADLNTGTTNAMKVPFDNLACSVTDLLVFDRFLTVAELTRLWDALRRAISS